MSTGTIESNPARRDMLLQSALAVFLRYGYKKASMDDVARAAGLSRQGLYLHFATKEDLFTESVIFLMSQSRAASQAALTRDDVSIEERLLGAFMALKTNSDGTEMSQEHMAELMATATRLAGPAIDSLEHALVDDLAQVIEDTGLAARWHDAGLTARDLAQHLLDASHGIKHAVKTAADYRARMRVAVRVVCYEQSLARIAATATPERTR